jgi:hypothetical protein
VEGISLLRIGGQLALVAHAIRDGRATSLDQMEVLALADQLDSCAIVVAAEHRAMLLDALSLKVKKLHADHARLASGDRSYPPDASVRELAGAAQMLRLVADARG